MTIWHWLLVGYIFFLLVFVLCWMRFWQRINPPIPEDLDSEDQRS